MIGLGLGLTSVAIAGGYVWSPSKLNPLFWAGSLDPASGRMWQDSAGVTPVTAAGQPVGRMLSSAGAIAAIQPTALSRPTLARWPKGGRRNLGQYSEDISQWSKFGATTPSADTMLETETIAEHRVDYDRALSTASGTAYTAVVEAQVIGDRQFRMAFNTPPFPTNNRAAVFDLTGDGVILSVNSGVTATITKTADNWYRCRITATANAQSSIGAIYTHPVKWTGSSATVSYLGEVTCGIKLRKAQVEAGAEPTPYQKVTTANDVTEAGVPDVWHLFDDGGDSLPAVFPAVNLHLAYVNQLGDVSYSTAMSDGTTGVDLLLAERMADVIVLDRAFAPDEEAKIEAYWARYAA